MLERIRFHPLLVVMLTLALSNLAFPQDKKKVAYGVLIDNTRSLETQFPQLTTLAKVVVRHVHQRGSISLFSFMTQGDKRNPLAVVTSRVELSQDERLLNNSIDSLMIVAGQTTLMDAISTMAAKLDGQAGLDKDMSTDKIIILLTDGEDRVSKIKEKQLIKDLKERGIKVYAIGFVQALDEEGGLMRKSRKEIAMTFLKKVTKETNGRVILPTSKQTEVDALLSELLAK